MNEQTNISLELLLLNDLLHNNTIDKTLYDAAVKQIAPWLNTNPVIDDTRLKASA